MGVNRRDFLKIAGTTGAVIAANGCRGLGGGGSEAGGGDGGGGTTPPPGGGGGDINSVEHIIFTMQENRSFDHYFGKLPQYRQANGIPGEVDGLPEGGASNPSYDESTTIESHHLGTDQHENLSPAWNESHRCWNRHDPAGPMPALDGFVYAAANYSRQTTEPACDFEGRRAMGYYTENELPYYYALASKFAMSDRHFSSVMTATQPNRMYLLAGSSYGYIRPLRETNGDRQVAAPTIFERLQDKGISWKIYLMDKGAPHAFSYYALFQGYNSHSDKVVKGEQFFDDVKNGNLPQVVMFESGVSNGLDEHPRNDIFKGTQIMRRLFNAIMQSPIWGKSVTFFTYDEGGGFYDHVPPPTAVKPDDIPPKLLPQDTVGDFDRYGYRVPFVAVSPFSRKNYVSHTVSDHTSILKFIEKRFGLSSLTNRDAAAHDFSDMFDFANPPYVTPPSMPGDGAHPLSRCDV